MGQNTSSTKPDLRCAAATPESRRQAVPNTGNVERRPFRRTTTRVTEGREADMLEERIWWWCALDADRLQFCPIRRVAWARSRLCGACHIGTPEQSVDHGTQGHCAERFVQQMVAALARFTQALRRCIAAYEKCRDRRAKSFTNMSNGRNTGSPVREVVVADNEIGTLLGREVGQGFVRRRGSHDAAAPIAQQAAHAVERKRIVIDHEHKFASGRIDCNLRRLRLRDLPPGSSHGHHDAKSRTLAQGRDQLDGMAEQGAQAVHDGKAEAETALGIASSEAVEFAEDIPPLVFGNPRPAVPDFDVHRVTAPPATHDDAARDGVANRTGYRL